MLSLDFEMSNTFLLCIVVVLDFFVILIPIMPLQKHLLFSVPQDINFLPEKRKRWSAEIHS